MFSDSSENADVWSDVFCSGGADGARAFRWGPL